MELLSKSGFSQIYNIFSLVTMPVITISKCHEESTGVTVLLHSSPWRLLPVYYTRTSLKYILTLLQLVLSGRGEEKLKKKHVTRPCMTSQNVRCPLWPCLQLPVPAHSPACIITQRSAYLSDRHINSDNFANSHIPMSRSCLNKIVKILSTEFCKFSHTCVKVISQ